MGFFSPKKNEVALTASALEQARSQAPASGLSGSVNKLIENLLSVGIQGKGPFDSAADIASSALAKAGGNVEDAVSRVIRTHQGMAAGEGFVTSLGGFITLPVALPANVFGFYALATRMTASVAILRGYDIKDPQIRSAILLSLVGAEAPEVLAKAGMVTPTGRLTSMATERLSGPALAIINKAVGFRILSSSGRNLLQRFGRNIPLVGGVVGASLDGYLMTKLAESVRKDFPPNVAPVAPVVDSTAAPSPTAPAQLNGAPTPEWNPSSTPPTG